MALYLFHGIYSPSGIKGVLSEGGSARLAAIQPAVESLGGRVESMLFAHTGDHVFVLLDLPEPAAATTLSMLTLSSGAFLSGTATPVLRPDELDAAIGNVGRATYRAPGG